MTTEFKIESGVELPVRSKRDAKYPWDQMTKVGNSFFAAGVKSGTLASNAHKDTMESNKKYKVRDVTENGIEGSRVWYSGDKTPEEIAKSAQRKKDNAAKKPADPKPASNSPFQK